MLSFVAGVTEAAGFIEWTQNEGYRALGVGFIGALVGGGFTVLGQAIGNRAQRQRDEAARVAQIEDMRRADAQSDVRALFESFVQLMGDIRRAVPEGDPPIEPTRKTRFTPGGAKWHADWERIWTPERESIMRAGAELIPDPGVRQQVVPVVIFLDEARELAAVAHRGPVMDLREIVGRLTAMGIKVLGAYLRRDELDEYDRTLIRAGTSSLKQAYEQWERRIVPSGSDAAKEVHEVTYDALAQALLPDEQRGGASPRSPGANGGTAKGAG